ncbi:hypothetical protein [Streptomyces chartreusis]|uniref:hypothetical protein n=1 Tax=Streptomyces chartreusis TaxID=1969 RepID=UPI0036B64C3C
MTPFEASMCFESTVPVDRVSSMRSVILPRPEAIAMGVFPHLVPMERTWINRLAMIARFPLATSELFVLGVACAEVPIPSRLTDKAATMAPRWTVWKFN